MEESKGSGQPTREQGVDASRGAAPKNEPMTSHTVGYDSAQKSGYDSSIESPEARRTTNAVHSQGRQSDIEREADEKDARKD